MNEPEIIVHHREQLAELLTEAVEVEHNLMCCYLYAAWSLRSGEADGLTAPQARHVESWRRTILHVAIDEMTHFANANNLLAALGGRPHLNRPNFPVSPGYHPAGVIVELRRFEAATIDHFVFLERPEGVDLADGEGYARPLPYERATRSDAQMPSVQDYATVGHLYRAIQDGMQKLAAQIGEERLFVGDPTAQLDPSMVQLDGLVAVRDLRSALQAIENIVQQGEGNADNPENSHYRRFCSIRDELAALQAEDPTFDPARAVVRSPVQRKPPVPGGKTWIQAPDSARVLDLCNALYNHMLRLLGVAYDALPARTRAGVVDEAIALMKQLSPLNELLTRLPASADEPHAKAGMSFAVTREIRVPSPRPSTLVLAERTQELAAGARSLAAIDPQLQRTASELDAMARRIEGLPSVDALVEPPAVRKLASVGTLEHSADASIPPRTITDGVETIEGKKLTLHFDTRRCIHTRWCVTGAPDVFIGNVQGPWIRPDAIDVEELAAIAQRCPSGAITYERKDGRPNEAAPKVNMIRIYENGPYAVTAALKVEGEAPRIRATLCRCGASKRKPFCDGSHHEIGFVASGEPPTTEVTPLEARDGDVQVRPQLDGPLLVTGNLEICAATGRTVSKLTRGALCRCGGSQTKPFCDGTHKTIGFKSST